MTTVSSLPSSTAAPSFTIYCTISGVPLADVTFRKMMAGSDAYMKGWKQAQAQHALFAEPLSVLIAKSNARWNLEKAGKQEWPIFHKQLMFLALLHSSGSIQQTSPALPPAFLVEAEFPRLFDLLCKKHVAASSRLTFPRLRISPVSSQVSTPGMTEEAAKKQAAEARAAMFATVPSWITACEMVYEDWENRIRSKQRAAKQKAQDLALRNIRSAAYADISLRKLWNWVEAQVDTFELDKNADLKILFFADESKIHNWDKEDLQALEEFIFINCERGNSVSYEVIKRLDTLKKWHANYADAFEIVTDGASLFAESVGIEEPKQSDFPNKASYFVAKARWTLANKAAPASKDQGSQADEL